jgi:hypothetical protein
MRRRQERKRMQEEEQKQPTVQEPTLVEETPDDVQISQKNENTETTTNTPKFVISGVKYVYLIVCFALLSGIFYPLVMGEGWTDTLKGIGVLAVGLFGGILLYKSITSEKRRGVLMCCGFGLIAVSLIIIYELIGSPLYQ